MDGIWWGILPFVAADAVGGFVGEGEAAASWVEMEGGNGNSYTVC